MRIEKESYINLLKKKNSVKYFVGISLSVLPYQVGHLTYCGMI